MISFKSNNRIMLTKKKCFFFCITIFIFNSFRLICYIYSVCLCVCYSCWVLFIKIIDILFSWTCQHINQKMIFLCFFVIENMSIQYTQHTVVVPINNLTNFFCSRHYWGNVGRWNNIFLFFTNEKRILLWTF